MNKLLSLNRIIFIFLLLIASVLSIGCSNDSDSEDESLSKLKIVATTSMISSIVEAVAGSEIVVDNIIPPSQCPGHFDVGPDAIRTLADGDLFLLHGWQGEMFSDKLIKSADNPDLKVVVLKAQGNLMSPSVQAEAVDEITSALAEVDPENQTQYAEKAEEIKGNIQTKDSELKALLKDKGTTGVNVICNEKQFGFVKWAGFNVVDSYGRPEDLDPKTIQDLIDKSKEANVFLVIDNLQSGGKPNKGMAKEIGAEQVTLSNFPGAFKDTETWAQAIEENVSLLLEAYTKYQTEHMP